ncbi:[FeFe] hydrogenase H-cluster maturation GTPase HydF [Neofamilia massiliensis]|uniref:[FeFe] hydrogenase H-cluster maturation GTPase HydF n=1 Tax=Neofamilia massiliensis TaxID=1673724 RepID=UPI0006BB6DF5|nr:[FeFe] hydrogenase H-cluster maturation GTPase HydF [Neofamilia massiliensis]
MDLNKTNSGNRVHIGFFGRVNAGKSSLINAFANREISIVSDQPGTTTDPVYKSIELKNLGPSLLMDTAGLVDQTNLGVVRTKRTKEVLEKTDLAIIVVAGADLDVEKDLIKSLKDTPRIIAINKIDILSTDEIQKIKSELPGETIVEVSAKEKTSIDKLLDEILKFAPKSDDQLFENMVEEKDLVFLVVPQDIAAPKNRLILPQVQALRELLDRNCISLMIKLEEFETALRLVNKKPDLIVADSSVFLQVYEKKPANVRLTSFSVLFAKLKGDIDEYVKGARAFKNINSNSRILIAESCAHAPTEEDIGRVKIPNMIRKKFGDEIIIDNTSGPVLPENLETYDLIIQCGGCMQNKKSIQGRIKKAQEKNIPITNYGIAIAYFMGILDKITY